MDKRRRNVSEWRVFFCFLVLLSLFSPIDAKSQRPNILFILADDLGHADVDWHDTRLHTPNLRKLAFSQHSVYLKQSYVNQLCTPTRSAMMTGHYPFKTGTQHGVFLNMEAGGVPLDFPFLPERLRPLGYKNYLIGKWHLGYCRKEFLPTARGFDYFYGYYGPQEGYFNHSTDLFDRNSGRVVRGLDFFRETKGQMHPITDKNGMYSTHVFTDETLRVLDAHPRTHPFFLLLSYQSVHAPLQAPASYRSVCSAFAHDFRRLVYCAMLAAMDESIGRVVQRLKKAGLYENTVIVFSSDGFRLFHVVDWNPTLLGVAGSSEMLYGDGINQWPSIAEKGTRRLRRTQFIYNIDTPASGIRRGNFKLIHEATDVLHDPHGRSRLFDLAADANETTDLARRHPKVVADLLGRLRRAAAKSRRSVRTPMDARGHPDHFSGVFGGNWC